VNVLLSIPPQPDKFKKEKNMSNPYGNNSLVFIDALHEEMLPF
jgi:hypothetical protein